MVGYSAKANLITKVLDFVQLGGPGWTRTNDLGLIRTATVGMSIFRPS